MLKQRIMTAVPALAALLIVLFVLPPMIAKLAFAAMILIGAWEWSGLLKLQRRIARLGFVALIAALLVTFVLVADDVAVDVVLKVALAWWLIALIWVFNFPTPIPKMAGWICGVLVLIPAYLAIVSLYSMAPAMLLFVLIIVWAADVGAYFVGKRFGRVKLAPSISPGKTWEGVLGGLALVAVLALVRAHWLEINIAVLLPFCLAVASISIIGDLTVSMFKRNAGVKDSGQLFPGHGGVLDRIDSVTAAAPLFALGISWVGLR
jgi:phosphatidate cytidylyltransferase